MCSVEADLAAALDGLLVEVVGAAPGAVKAGLEAVADVKSRLMAPLVSALAVRFSRSPPPQSASRQSRRERPANPPYR
jgi:hypothetical protein